MTSTATKPTTRARRDQIRTLRECMADVTARLKALGLLTPDVERGLRAIDEALRVPERG